LSKDFAPNHSPDVLLEKLAAMTARAEAAERANAGLELERFNAMQQAKQADVQISLERARIANLEQSVERLSALSENTAYSLASLPVDQRSAVASAREHAWRGRLAAARAAEAAERHADALTWPKAHATYSGETRNRLPHGHGVMVFRDGGQETARYAGAFEDGHRSGHGIATSDSGHLWSGQWIEGEACGFGLLETPDGGRFEGEVAPDQTGSPRRVRGWTWAATSGGAASAPHHVMAPALPPPRAAGR
jgi:hypothetical protein